MSRILQAGKEIQVKGINMEKSLFNNRNFIFSKLKDTVKYQLHLNIPVSVIENKMRFNLNRINI
jgi:hypothetical protein